MIMPILLWVGANQHGIAEQLSTLKRKLDPTWIAFNYHQFSALALAEALIAVRTPAVGDHRKVVVVEDCNFSNQSQFGERQLEMLQVIDRIPDTTLLIFIAASIDKRLKVVKHLLKHGQLKEFPLIPPWRSDLIVQAISKAAARLNATQDKVAKLVLSRECVNYLAGAIGNDLTRVDSELRKLKVYAQGKRLTKAEVEALVPCQTQNTLQLAEAMRKGDAAIAATLLNELLSRSEVPMVIMTTLITQFRTWLWVKSTLTDRTKRKDIQIAQICGIANPNRLYYLRQDVAATPVKSLVQTITYLFDLEVTLKQGSKPDSMLPMILAITRLFQRQSKSLA
jgi:DNA polymerase-3 subunit delta